MNELQHFLNVQPLVNYEKLFKFDPTKGFYCPVVSATGGLKCLGKGKGRQYPPMDKISRKFLDNYFYYIFLAASKHICLEVFFG